MDFEQLFKQMALEEMPDNVFSPASVVFPVITAGNVKHYNSMTGSGGGMGVLFKKPVTWCILRADRYTLELMQKVQTYTMSYFAEEYRQQVMFLGSKSGRDSDKTKEVQLKSIQTPSGNISFEEAKLIIECKLVQITTPQLDDFYTQETKEWLKETYKQPGDIRKYVFGEITDSWVNVMSEKVSS